MTNSDYAALCKKNAERFLKTAFLLDDEVVFQDKESSEIPQSMDLDVAEDNLPFDANDLPTEPISVGLNGRAMTEAFFRKGIVLSVIKPDRDKPSMDDLEKNIIQAILQVDLPILDWNIWDDDGEWIIKILNRLITEHQYPEGRVALLMIYTEQSLIDVRDKLTNNISDFISESDDSNLLVLGGLRVLIIQRDEIVDEKQLPGFLIEEFSKIHSGILENTVIQAISEIREKTFHLLSRFTETLDAPFLAHRAVLPNPLESGRHAFELISSEIEALLIQSDLPEYIFQPGAIARSVDNILEQKLINAYRDGVQPNIPKIRDEIREIIEGGLPDKDQQTYLIRNTLLKAKKTKEKEILSQLTDLLSQGGENESDLNAEFSELFAFEHNYYDSPKQLTLGTLICGPSNRKNPNYELCVLPFCDSDRRDGKVSVPFLILSIQDKLDKKFDMTISHNGVRMKLYLDYSPEKITKHPFIPAEDSGGKILSNGGIFSTAYSSDYQWIGTIKREFALRIANRLGSEISRVGLNESEWQRLSMK